MQTSYNGKQYTDIIYEARLAACIKEVEKDSNLTIHYDLDTGYPSLITKEQDKLYRDMLKSITTSLTPSDCKDILGKVICCGISGEIDSKELANFKKLFCDDNKL